MTRFSETPNATYAIAAPGALFPCAAALFGDASPSTHTHSTLNGVRRNRVCQRCEGRSFDPVESELLTVLVSSGQFFLLEEKHLIRTKTHNLSTTSCKTA